MNGNRIRAYGPIFRKKNYHFQKNCCILVSVRIRRTDPFISAGVAELADAADSKSADRKIVWVRVPPPAVMEKTPSVFAQGFGNILLPVRFMHGVFLI